VRTASGARGRLAGVFHRAAPGRVDARVLDDIARFVAAEPHQTRP